MCDMQKMPRDDDDVSLEEDPEMNFAAFSSAGAAGTHFVTSTGQIAKIQQNVTNNGNALSQVVGMVSGVNMGEGMQYVRALDGGATLHTTPQIISVPIALPTAKPGDPQPTVQIQVLNPNMLQAQQQPKYQMQIPIQGFQQGAVLTVAYSPETNEAGGIQIVGNGLPEGLQVLAALPPELQMMQAQAQLQDNKDNIQQQQTMQQVIFTQNQQIVINGTNDKMLNNNNNNNSDAYDVIIKEECLDNNDDESSQGTEHSDSISWTMNSSSQQDLLKYLNSLPPQQTQALPGPLQQFLRLNPSEVKKQEPMDVEVEVEPADGSKDEAVAEAVFSEDGTLRITNKKKKKYKKKPAKPAKPKPGQVVIAKAADGSTIYCCPECQMAYSDKEQLELHLIVHKIERRYICGICGAGLKRKEHLERHKLGHNPERPYVCSVCRKGFKRREHLNLHAVIHSGVKTEMCTLCGKGFYRKDHLRKHTRSHEARRLRDDAPAAPAAPAPAAGNAIMPEITIHVPTSANMNVPVQINIPQHVVSSLAAQQAAQQANNTDTQTQLDALLAQHT